MSNLDVSIYIPGIRPQLWERVWKSLVENSVSWEIIFVGHVPPTFALPTNVRHIYSPVKPAQCSEIGFRACEGEFCIYSHDDIFFGEHTLDRLVDRWHKIKGELIAVSCLPYVMGKLIPTRQYLFWDSVVGSPPVPITALYKRSVLQAIGSRDKNFIASYSDVDLAMRFYQVGGRHTFCKDTMADEDYGFHDPNRLIWTGLKYDRPLLDKLWTMTRAEYAQHPNRKNICFRFIHPKLSNCLVLRDRAQLVEPFVEEGLLIASQGPKGPEGKWT